MIALIFCVFRLPSPSPLDFAFQDLSVIRKRNFCQSETRNPCRPIAAIVEHRRRRRRLDNDDEGHDDNNNNDNNNDYNDDAAQGGDDMLRMITDD